MTDERLRQILAHAYGQGCRITAMGPTFRPATAADIGKLMWGHPDLGTWCGPAGEYTPAENELVISRAESLALVAAKLLAPTIGETGGLITTARGRDHWRRLGCPA